MQGLPVEREPLEIKRGAEFVAESDALNHSAVTTDVQVSLPLALNLLGRVHKLQFGRPDIPFAEPSTITAACRLRQDQGGINPGEIEVASHLENLLLGIDAGEVDDRDRYRHRNTCPPLTRPPNPFLE